jgi:hypothetical protein
METPQQNSQQQAEQSPNNPVDYSAFGPPINFDPDFEYENPEPEDDDPSETETTSEDPSEDDDPQPEPEDEFDLTEIDRLFGLDDNPVADDDEYVPASQDFDGSKASLSWAIEAIQNGESSESVIKKVESMYRRALARSHDARFYLEWQEMARGNEGQRRLAVERMTQFLRNNLPDELDQLWYGETNSDDNSSESKAIEQLLDEKLSPYAAEIEKLKKANEALLEAQATQAKMQKLKETAPEIAKSYNKKHGANLSANDVLEALTVPKKLTTEDILYLHARATQTRKPATEAPKSVASPTGATSGIQWNPAFDHLGPRGPQKG